jgi:glutamate 5-kinase
MATKISAAKRAARSGTHTIIASGREPDVLLRLEQNENIGTCLIADQPRFAARKNWIANQLQLAGKLSLDAGAVKALTEGGKSLLPIGVTAVSGNFRRGAMVACVSPEGKEIAHGLVNYSSDEAQKILKKTSVDIPTILGYMNEPELIHRDNLALTYE